VHDEDLGSYVEVRLLALAINVYAQKIRAD
jgi:hypothetical protein